MKLDADREQRQLTTLASHTSATNRDNGTQANSSVSELKQPLSPNSKQTGGVPPPLPPDSIVSKATAGCN